MTFTCGANVRLWYKSHHLQCPAGFTRDEAILRELCTLYASYGQPAIVAAGEEYLVRVVNAMVGEGVGDALDLESNARLLASFAQAVCFDTIVENAQADKVFAVNSTEVLTPYYALQAANGTWFKHFSGVVGAAPRFTEVFQEAALFSKEDYGEALDMAVKYKLKCYRVGMTSPVLDHDGTKSEGVQAMNLG